MSTDCAQAGALTGYRERVYRLVAHHLRAIGPIGSAIDVGAGEGWYAARLQREGVIDLVIPIEVVRRKRVLIEPTLYDGVTIPFADRSTELAYAVDVVHHTGDPLALLGEIARVSSRWILLKDHTFKSRIGCLTLAVLDELGNRRFGIPSPGNYQREFEWVAYLRTVGFDCVQLTHPAVCQRGALGVLTNHLQFVAVFERRDAR